MSQRYRALGDGLRRSPTLPSALLAIAIFLALGASDAGYFPVSSDRQEGLGWYPATLLLLLLLVVTVAAVGRPRAAPRTLRLALLLLACYAAWSYLSIAWAGDQAVAWEGANRTAGYVVVLALFALWPLRPGAGLVALAALGLGVAALGLIELLAANGSSDPTVYFIDARFDEPAGYINANVALWMLGALPCVAIAASREAAVPVRGLCLGGAGLLTSLALMGQSRGWALALPPALLLFLALSPRRVRVLAALLAVGAGTYAIKGPILDLHDRFTPARLDSLLSSATGPILLVAALLAVAGTVAALLDRALEPDARRERAVGLATAAVVAVVAVAGVALFVAEEGSPVDNVSHSWRTFKRGETQPEVGASRFSGAGTNRYDAWRVAWKLFREHPLGGIGSENYQVEYLRRGRSGELLLYPHSLELGVLSQTGLIGGLLLAGAFLAALAAVLSARRRSREAAAVAAAGAGVFLYWLLHASVDWFWEFPGLTGPALAMLGMAATVAREPARAPLRRAPPRRASALPLSRLAPAGVAVLLLALAASLVLPWLAERDVARAADRWPASPKAAFDRLDRARSLNPLSARPDLVAGTIALRLGDTGKAEREFRAALRRHSSDGYALLELGLIAAQRGRRADALRLLERRAELTPRDEVAKEALAAVRKGVKIDPARVNRRLLRRALLRAGRTH